VKQWFALSAIGRDRPGIVADLAELIFECDCNLEDSSMTILGGEFAVLLLLSGQSPDCLQRLSAACKRLEWEKRLTVFFRPLEEEPLPYGANNETRGYELVATGVDKAGIVARVARCLAEQGVNIVQMQTSTQPEPGHGTVIYHMQISLAVPSDVAETTLRDQLDRIADDLRIHIDLTASVSHDQRRTA
jgi:glycine cleavage system transcriptional repressor